MLRTVSDGLLLCELHAHTTWSDGYLTLRDSVDMYGEAGFDVLSWVAEARLPVIATGDTHTAEQLSSWKTLVPCRKDERAVLEYLRSRDRVYLAPFAPPEEIRLPIAA
jgi:histidinol phosphatase-like PHP family hydrolase